MTLVRFHKADGTLDAEVEAPAGERLLDIAWRARQPLEGACEGVMACSTCHVIVDPEDFAKLPPASEEEEDLLDIAAHVTRTSRLACQIILTEEMEVLTSPETYRAEPEHARGRERPAPSDAERRPGAPRKNQGDVGRVLRSVYDITLNEDIPDDFLDLLGKLD